VRRIYEDGVRDGAAFLAEQVRRASLPPYLSAEDVQKMTGWSLRTLARLRKNRKLEYAGDERRHAYPTEAVLAYLDARHVPVLWDELDTPA
jgi:hypothetical protein